MGGPPMQRGGPQGRRGGGMHRNRFDPEALARFATIKPEALPTKLQHDYFRCYAAFYEEKLLDARKIAATYADYPVDRWRTLFAEITAQLDEVEGQAAPREGDKPDREKQQGALAD